MMTLKEKCNTVRILTEKNKPTLTGVVIVSLIKTDTVHLQSTDTTKLAK